MNRKFITGFLTLFCIFALYGVTKIKYSVIPATIPYPNVEENISEIPIKSVENGPKIPNTKYILMTYRLEYYRKYSDFSGNAPLRDF